MEFFFGGGEGLGEGKKTWPIFNKNVQIFGKEPNIQYACRKLDTSTAIS